jgi:methyltransferase (TIGR00027 family)
VLQVSNESAILNRCDRNKQTMKANTPSRTAQYMALFRAIETERPANKRLFTDKYAINFLDKGLRTATKISGLPIIGSLIPKIIHRKAVGALSSGTARTKFIDDLLFQTIQNGIQQVLILGAGFDTRALRLDFLKEIPVIEIDHPDTSKFKIEKLKQTGQLPDNIRYLQIDFNKQSLDELAQKNKIDFSTPTAIIWEGVTNYLTQETIDKTFELIKRFSQNSFIIFTYIHKLVLDNATAFEGTEKLFENLEQNEEQWTFGFIPSELPKYLQQFGMTLIDDKGAAEYREIYIPERKGLLNGYEFYRVAFAKRTDEDGN